MKRLLLLVLVVAAVTIAAMRMRPETKPPSTLPLSVVVEGVLAGYEEVFKGEHGYSYLVRFKDGRSQLFHSKRTIALDKDRSYSFLLLSPRNGATGRLMDVQEILPPEPFELAH